MVLRISKWTLALILFGGLFVLTGNSTQAQGNKNKTTTLSGKIFRSDTKQPIKGAKISLSSYHPGKRLEAITDEKGNYSFEQIKAGKYRVDIHVRYNKQSESPCSVLGSRVTVDKDSNVTLKDEGLGYVDVWVSIDPIRIYSNKPLTKDFDVACKGAYRNQ